MGFQAIVCLIILGLIATCLAQFPEKFIVQSKLDGKVLAVVEEYASPAGGPYQRRGVVPIDEDSPNVESWTFDIWDHPMEGNIYPLNSTFRFQNSLTTGLLCAHCYSYTHTYNVAQISEDGARMLRVVDGLTEPISCVKNEGQGKHISHVLCDVRDIEQHWFFV